MVGGNVTLANLLEIGSLQSRENITEENLLAELALLIVSAYIFTRKYIYIYVYVKIVICNILWKGALHDIGGFNTTKTRKIGTDRQASRTVKIFMLRYYEQFVSARGKGSIGGTFDFANQTAPSATIGERRGCQW